MTTELLYAALLVVIACAIDYLADALDAEGVPNG